MLTHERLTALLYYNPDTGLFFYRKSKRLAGGLDHGYIRLFIGGKHYYAHQVAWFYVHRVWVKKLDHRNEVKSDNRIKNLRPATKAQNMQNITNQKSNRSGVRGVHWDKANGVWRVQVWVDNVCHSIGRFATLEEAKAARNEAAERLHGEFANTNKEAN